MKTIIEYYVHKRTLDICRFSHYRIEIESNTRKCSYGIFFFQCVTMFLNGDYVVIEILLTTERGRQYVFMSSFSRTTTIPRQWTILNGSKNNNIDRFSKIIFPYERFYCISVRRSSDYGGRHMCTGNVIRRLKASGGQTKNQ